MPLDTHIRISAPPSASPHLRSFCNHLQTLQVRPGFSYNLFPRQRYYPHLHTSPPLHLHTVANPAAPGIPYPYPGLILPPYFSVSAVCLGCPGKGIPTLFYSCSSLLPLSVFFRLKPHPIPFHPIPYPLPQSPPPLSFLFLSLSLSQETHCPSLTEAHSPRFFSFFFFRLVG